MAPQNPGCRPERLRAAGIWVVVALALAAAVAQTAPLGQPGTAQAPSVLQVPAGFRVEKVADGLTYPTAVAWDNQGNLYVVEAGGQFLEEPAPIRIMRVNPSAARQEDRVTEVVNLDNKGIFDPVVGATWHNGAFFITHRADDRTGAVSRVTPEGTVTPLLRGVIDSQAEHFLNDIRVGPDGRMYVASGPAGNSAVVGIDIAPFVSRSPTLHTTPAQDIVLTGMNFQTPDFRTDDPSDLAVTGAYVPFGTPTTPGQVIKGTNKPGGAILVFDPSNAEGTVRPFAWGFRNVIGFAWNAQGQMFAAVNGYDIRGSRPVKDEFDATYRVRQGAWYGWPDFSAALEPLTDPKFNPPSSQMAPVLVNGQPQEKKLGFLIDHARSGLTPPDRSLILGRHEWNSSPSLMDVAPASWGNMAGHVFVAEWGDLAPPTNPLRNGPAGYRISRIDPLTGRVEPFLQNVKPGPASAQGAPGQGLERPFGVRFGPDGALYMVDYGVARINPARAAKGQVPYEFPPGTGVIWRVTRGVNGAVSHAAEVPTGPFAYIDLADRLKGVQ